MQKILTGLKAVMPYFEAPGIILIALVNSFLGLKKQENP
ncbi:MAG: hypothetical protein CM15mP23_14190 [Cryomorphaceae bacterium]|nr:MAG: hypothetical protein CM15mP23_14190 [Cryomorphaceae bacterium]